MRPAATNLCFVSLFGFVLLALSTTNVAAGNCSIQSVIGIGKDPGVPLSAGYHAILKTEKRARKRAMSDWLSKVQSNFTQFAPVWGHARNQYFSCEFYGETLHGDREWGEVTCQARANPCTYPDRPLPPKRKKPVYKCAANDFKCKAKLIKQRKKFTPGPDGVLKGVRKLRQ